MKGKKTQRILNIDYDDLGMNIRQPSLIDLCRKERNCKFFRMQEVFGLCKNPVCYLHLQYQLRYKDEGHKWGDMHYNLREGCFCFEHAERFKDCPMKNAANSLCRNVIRDYPEPPGDSA